MSFVVRSKGTLLSTTRTHKTAYKIGDKEGTFKELLRSGATRGVAASPERWGYTPEPGMLYVATRAISSRVNANYDGWPKEELEKAWRTFIGRCVFVEHQNHDPQRSRGVIMDAKFHKDKLGGKDDWWVELLKEVDARAYPRLAQAIINGDITATSMGADVGYTICSACGNKAEDPRQYCNHIPAMKGMRTRTANGEQKLIWEDCYDINFFEDSFVFDPADESALIADFYMAPAGATAKAANRKRAAAEHCESCGSTDYEDLHTGDQGYTACCNEPICHGEQIDTYGTPAKNVRACCWGKASQMGVNEGSRMSARTADSIIMSLPDDVDTLREEVPCPVCGNEFDAEYCEACGYEEPPEGLGDPDTEPRGEAAQRLQDIMDEHADLPDGGVPVDEYTERQEVEEDIAEAESEAEDAAEEHDEAEGEADQLKDELKKVLGPGEKPSKPVPEEESKTRTTPDATQPVDSFGFPERKTEPKPKQRQRPGEPVPPDQEPQRRPRRRPGPGRGRRPGVIPRRTTHKETEVRTAEVEPVPVGETGAYGYIGVDKDNWPLFLGDQVYLDGEYYVIQNDDKGKPQLFHRENQSKKSLGDTSKLEKISTRKTARNWWILYKSKDGEPKREPVNLAADDAQMAWALVFAPGSVLLPPDLDWGEQVMITADEAKAEGWWGMGALPEEDLGQGRPITPRQPGDRGLTPVGRRQAAPEDGYQTVPATCASCGAPVSRVMPEWGEHQLCDACLTNAQHDTDPFGGTGTTFSKRLVPHGDFGWKLADGNVNDHLKGSAVISTGEAGPGHARWHGPDFPGWGDPDAASYLIDPRPGVRGVIVSVDSHGNRPWTRYSIEWETGERVYGAVMDEDFKLASNVNMSTRSTSSTVRGTRPRRSDVMAQTAGRRPARRPVRRTAGAQELRRKVLGEAETRRNQELFDTLAQGIQTHAQRIGSSPDRVLKALAQVVAEKPDFLKDEDKDEKKDDAEKDAAREARREKIRERVRARRAAQRKEAEGVILPDALTPDKNIDVKSDGNAFSLEEVRSPDAKTTVDGDPHGGIGEAELVNAVSTDVETEVGSEQSRLNDADRTDKINDGSSARVPAAPGTGIQQASVDSKARLFDVFAFVEEREKLGLSSRGERVKEIARFEAMTDEQLTAWQQSTREFAASTARTASRRVALAPRQDAGETPLAGRVPAFGRQASASTPDGDDPIDDTLALL